MKSKTFNLEIVIDEKRKVEVKTLIGESLSKDDFWHFYFVPFLESNLESAIVDLVSQMIEDELKIIFESRSGILTIQREKMIRDVTSKYQRQVRKRINKHKDYLVPVQLKGRNLNQYDLFIERTKFCKNFSEICHQLKNENRKLNKINIAKQLYPNNSNPSLTINRKLDEICWTFRDVLRTYLDLENNKDVN